jgi:hypothetical protein
MHVTVHIPHKESALIARSKKAPERGAPEPSCDAFVEVSSAR